MNIRGKPLRRCNRLNRAASLLVILFVPTLALSHTGTEYETNGFGWFVYDGDHSIQGRWGIHLDAQWRRSEMVMRPQQVLLRPALNIALSDSITTAVGYVYSRTYPYGEHPDPASYPEHRLFEQLTLKHVLRLWQLSHRLRVEQRYIAQAETIPSLAVTDWRYGNRLRYQLGITHPLRNGSYWTASIEPQVRFGIHYRGRAMDQQQSYFGVGRKVAEDWKIEVGYSYQTGVPRRGRIYEHNHIVEFTIHSTAPFPRPQK